MWDPSGERFYASTVPRGKRNEDIRTGWNKNSVRLWAEAAQYVQDNKKNEDKMGKLLHAEDNIEFTYLQNYPSKIKNGKCKYLSA